MKSHHCLFKILKKQNIADGRKNGWTDGQCENSIPPTNTVCRGYKSPRFHFPKKEYSFFYATVQFHLFFSNSAWYKNTLDTPGVVLSFSQNKVIPIARFIKGIKIVYKKIIFPTCLMLHCNRHFGCHFAKQLGNSAASCTRNKAMMVGSFMNVTFNIISKGKWNCWKFKECNFSSMFTCTILPNGDNDNEAILKESQHSFDRHLDNRSSKISLFLIRREIIWEFHKFKCRW